jgi:hypothetical protein
MFIISFFVFFFFFKNTCLISQVVLSIRVVLFYVVARWPRAVFEAPEERYVLPLLKNLLLFVCLFVCFC